MARFYGRILVTPELLRGANHQKHDIWLSAAPWDAVSGSVVVDKLIVSTEPWKEDGYIDIDAITVNVLGSAEKHAKEKKS